MLLAFMQPTLAKYGRGPKGRFRVNDTVNSASIQGHPHRFIVEVHRLRRSTDDGQCPGAGAGGRAGFLAGWECGSSMVNALETSRGKLQDSKVLYLGTRAASGLHPFEKMLLPGGADYRQVHAADPSDNPFSASARGARLILASTTCPTCWMQSRKSRRGLQRMGRSWHRSGPYG